MPADLNPPFPRPHQQGAVQAEQIYCCPANSGPAFNMFAVIYPAKMLMPFLLSRMKKWNGFPTLRIKCTNSVLFYEVAIPAGKAEIFQLVGAA